MYVCIYVRAGARTYVGMTSDEEIGRVPELGPSEVGGPSTSGLDGGPAAGPSGQAGAQRRQRSGRSSADKEHKRLKRLFIY